MSVKSDQNREMKLKSARKLSQMMNLIDARDFTGSIQITVYADKGKATKIKSNVEEIEHPD